MARSMLVERCVIAFITAAILGAGAAAQNTPERRSTEAPLKVGDEAPPFTLMSLDGKEEFALTDFRAKKPVILFFGSYT